MPKTFSAFLPEWTLADFLFSGPEPGLPTGRFGGGDGKVWRISTGEWVWVWVSMGSDTWTSSKKRGSWRKKAHRYLVH